jgi:hypothetical protein
MVLTGLRTVSQADTEMIEKRKKNRQLCVGTVYYTDLNDGSSAAKKTARCSNACPAGMCIFTSKPLLPGSVIRISEIGKIWNLKAASVRWCEKLDGSLYREGISYLR